MKFILAAVFCFMALAPAMASTPSADFFIATNGNDNWSGKLASPNKDHSDGPFATMDRAKQAVRRLKSQSSDKHPITVMLRGGDYFLQNPVEFTPEDSGSADAPVIYTAYPGENPVINGGRKITGWKKTFDGKWEVQLPETASGQWNFCQLFVNGERRYRPILPKEGYLSVVDSVEPSDKAKGKGHDRFKYAPGDISSKWSNLSDVEILPFHLWTISRFRIGSLDEKNNIVTFTGNTLADVFWASFPKGNRYLVENVKEALDSPGEWYLDRKSGVLTYIPLKGEDMRKAEVIAPSLDYVVGLKGDIQNRRWVTNISFKGLTFMYSNWTLPAEGYTSSQGEYSLRGMLRAEGARNCVLDGCTFAHTGGLAVELSNGCKYDKVMNCEIVDLGGGGIKVGEGGYTEDTDTIASHITIRNNVIAHGGRIHPAGEGILVASSPYNRIVNNDIFDFYYTGISVGWSWGYAPSNAHHNTIENNHVFKIGQGVLSDMGGIYTLGIADGSVIRHNLFHDIDSYAYGGWGIYLDEGTTHMLVEDNVVYRTKTGGFHQHYGKENLIRNNIFAFAKEAQIIRTRAEEHKSFDFNRNIVIWNNGPLLGSNWSGSNYSLDNNLYWNTAGKPVTFAGMDIKDWQKAGNDLHSIFADPGFVNPEKGDFRLRPDSPALKIGFKPIDMSGFGSTGVRRRISDKSIPAALFPYDQSTYKISEGFENIPDGKTVPGFSIQTENDEAGIRVTDKTAASGRHSLQFTDRAGQKYNFNPHLFLTPDYNWGLVKLSFKLRMEQGAELWHEWRTGSENYQTGPSFSIKNGQLIVGDKKLIDIPYGQWLKFDITYDLYGGSIGSYNMDVSLPGKSKPVSFRNLPCDPRFISVRWIGFISNGDGPGTFYLDDVKLNQIKED